MSLKNLLAVGESFFGTNTSPYEVRKEHRLPVFGPAENQTAFAPLFSKEEKPQSELDFEKQREARVRIKPERRKFLERPSRGGARRLTQAEMGLEQVKVVRNDLSDSDLELAPRRAARSAEGDLNPFAPRPIAAIGRPAHEKLGLSARVGRWLRFLKRGKS